MLTKLFGGGKVIEKIADIIDDVYTSEEERLDKKVALERIQARLQEKQLEINKIEASGNFMQRSWRPFLAWSCSTGCRKL